MIGSPVVESSAHANPFKFGWTSVGGNAIATDVMIKRDYRIPFEYVVFERGVREYYSSPCSVSIISLFCVFQLCHSNCKNITQTPTLEHQHSNTNTRTPTLEHRYTSATSMWSRRVGDNIADVALEGEACCASSESKKACEIRGVPECASGLKCTLREAKHCVSY